MAVEYNLYRPGKHPLFFRLPRGWRKNRGRAPELGRLYFTAIQNYLLKTGGTGKTWGGMIFEQVCTK